MKKIVFLGAIVLLALSVSACTLKKPAPSEENVAPTSASSDEDINLADDNTATAPVNPSAIENANMAVASGTTVQTIATMPNPSQQEDLTKKYSQALIKTSVGDITVKFYASDSPKTVNNFLSLAQAGFYNGTKFHRVIKDFMIQGGDPLSKETNTSVWGTGGPGYQFADEFNTHKLVLGSLAMANSGPDTNGSQFFIVTAAETPWLDGHHTNFGQVTAGLDVVKKIEAVETGVNDRPVQDIVITGVELLK